MVLHKSNSFIASLSVLLKKQFYELVWVCCFYSTPFYNTLKMCLLNFRQTWSGKIYFMNDMPLSSSNGKFSSVWSCVGFDWNNLFKKYPLIVFLFDLRWFAFFLFSFWIFFIFWERNFGKYGIICDLLLDYLGLKKIVLWTVIGLIYNYFCTNSNFIYSIILIAFVCVPMYHILICYKDWNSVSKSLTVLFEIFIHLQKELIRICMQKKRIFLCT